MAYQTATHHTLQNKRVNGISDSYPPYKTRENGKSDIDDKSVMAYQDNYPPHTKNKRVNGKSDSYLTHIKKDKSVMAYQTATHHTLQTREQPPPHTTKQESNGKSDSYLTQIKRQVSDGISESYPPHTTKQEKIRQLPNTDQKTTSSSRERIGVSGWLPEHRLEDKSVMAYRQLPTTHTTKQESNGKSDSYLTQIKRQVSDGISDSYPPHTKQNKRVMDIRQLPNTDQKTNQKTSQTADGIYLDQRQVSDGISSHTHYKNKRVMAYQTASYLTQIKRQAVMAYRDSYPPHTTKQESNGNQRQLPNTDQKTNSYPPHTTKQESNGKSDSYLTHIKRQVSDAGISQSYPPHTTKQESNGKSDSYLTQIKDKSVMAYQTATHHTLKTREKWQWHISKDSISDSYPHTLQKQEILKIRSKDKDKSVMAYQTATHHTLQNKRIKSDGISDSYPPHTTKQESIGKSDSYLTHIKRQVSDGISDSYPPHTTKQESNGKSDSYLTQIKRQVSDGISNSYPPHTTKQESNGISDSYLTHIKDKSVMAYHTATHHTLQNKRVMANQTAT
ncbi:unnamed protein product [Mytilus edulis]|uniref:Uncharacterized protein n=1 Tax=Mytilus edulis TaxID=6550 RepID=A0A8S3S8J0_MYTED|nr:unnamed protein product [Mytilus edulis]